MSAERLLAGRYLIGRKRFNFINTISLLATLGIMFGVAALIVVLSVFNGFNSLVTSILQDFDPHIKIEKIPDTGGLSEADIEGLVRQRNDLTGFAPFIERKAMAMAGEYNNFVWIKGIDPEKVHMVSGIREKTVLGSFSFDTPNGIVLGFNLADKMHVLVGDTVTIVSPAGLEHILTQFVTPTVLECPVVGIYESKNRIYDGSYAFLTIQTARTLFHLGDSQTGFELRFAAIEASNSARDELQAAIGEGWNVLTWYDLHRDLYSVMEIERWSAFIILCVIIAVAVFNILASLTMLVLEKRRDIGILRTMGMEARRIRNVFLLEGLWIGLIGVCAGLFIGLSLTLLQQEFGLIGLDAAFIIPALPVEIRAADILLIIFSTFGLCMLSAWYPSLRARDVEIIDAIRWE